MQLVTVNQVEFQKIMCVAPITLENGNLVICRNCWQCHEKAKNDWVGRCIAESKTSRATTVHCLTYGPDENGMKNHVRSQILTYSDVQKYFKTLRYHGHKIRYFAVGEYGTTKGRAHWHVIVFWETEPFDFKENVREPQKYWPHGDSHIETATHENIAYVCKYLQKAQGPDQIQGKMSMSKKPPIGHEWFMQYAQSYVEQGLAPQNLFYQHPRSVDKAGKPKKYLMQGKTAENFLQRFVEKWTASKAIPIPNSELVEEYLDKQAGEDLELRFANTGYRAYVPKPKPHQYPIGYQSKGFSEKHNAYWCIDVFEKKLWFVRTEEGFEEWQRKIGGQ